MASVTLHGQKVGRIKASFLLTAESFRFLKADPEMMFLPIIGFFINIALWAPAVSIIFFGLAGGTFAGLESLFSFAESEQQALPPWMYVVIFYGLFISAFSIAFVQAGISHLVSKRARGQNDTLGGALSATMSILPALLLWSLITATVGFLLRQIAERSKLLMRILVGFLGVAWSVLTYFVIPALVIERKSTVDSIKRSGKVFRDSWGETIVSNISLSGFFMVLFFVLIIIYAVAMVLLLDSPNISPVPLVLVTIFFVFALFALALVHNTLTYVLKTLLFIYATEGTTAPNFDADLLANMLVKKNQAIPTPQVPLPPTTI